MNIESKLWKLRQVPGGSCFILQKASGVERYVYRGELPSDEALAAMTERQFDKVCREAFHGS